MNAYIEALHMLAVNGIKWADMGDLILRLGVGIPFFISGMNKLFCPTCHGWLLANLKRSNIVCPAYTVWWVAAWEALAGLSLALGFLTSLSAFILLVVCGVAFHVSWRRKLEKKNPAHFWDACTEIGFMFDVLLIWMVLAIGMNGPGVYSLDNLFGWLI